MKKLVFLTSICLVLSFTTKNQVAAFNLKMAKNIKQKATEFLRLNTFKNLTQLNRKAFYQIQFGNRFSKGIKKLKN